MAPRQTSDGAGLGGITPKVWTVEDWGASLCRKHAKAATIILYIAVPKQISMIYQILTSTRASTLTRHKGMVVARGTTTKIGKTNKAPITAV